jgi:hypothetical protein
VALFGKPKKRLEDGNGTSNGEGKPAFEAQPEEARQWLDRARATAESYNYEYALFCYANAIKRDPETMSAHEAMYEAAIQYTNRGGKPASGKEIRSIDDSDPVAKFAAAEFAWMKDLTNASLALKALAAASKAEQYEYCHWIAARVLNQLRRQKKLSKGTLLQAKELFAQIGAWDEALVAGEAALALDRDDADLEQEIKDLAAQRAMDKGGYEEAGGEEGGFRRLILDAEKQRELLDEETIAKTVSIDQRNLERARQEYETNPTLPDAINKYAQLLRAQGTPEAVGQAYDIFVRGHEQTGEYRFRMNAGNIKISEAVQRTEQLREKLERNSGSDELKAEYEQAREQQLELQESEYKDRVEKYPTDRHLKFYLGEVEYERTRYQDAMGCFQKAKDEPKLRARAAHMLGRCFAAVDWHMEAIAEYKEALGVLEAGDSDRELAIRYDLMVSLIEHARAEKSPPLAREALDICSGIARRDITYRDIRGRRAEVGALIKELGGE